MVSNELAQYPPSTDDDDQSEYPGPDETIAGTDTVIEGERKSDTLGVMFQTVSALGCQPTKNDDGTLSVSYLYGSLALYFGIKDFLSTLQSLRVISSMK